MEGKVLLGPILKGTRRTEQPSYITDKAPTGLVFVLCLMFDIPGA